MPRSCTICTHAERAALETTLLAGEAYRHIAARFGTSTAALQRHKHDHLPSHLAQAHKAEEVTQADGLLERLLTLSQETTAILQEARAGEDHELALKAIARAEKQIELQARLLGELKEGQTVNVLILPEWHHIRTMLVLALAPYPQARVAVAEALWKLDHATGHSA